MSWYGVCTYYVQSPYNFAFRSGNRHLSVSTVYGAALNAQDRAANLSKRCALLTRNTKFWGSKNWIAGVTTRVPALGMCTSDLSFRNVRFIMFFASCFPLEKFWVDPRSDKVKDSFRTWNGNSYYSRWPSRSVLEDSWFSFTHTCATAETAS